MFLPPLTLTHRLSVVYLHAHTRALCRQWPPYTECNSCSSSLLILLKCPVTTHDHGVRQPAKFPWLVSNQSPLTTYELPTLLVHCLGTLSFPSGGVEISLQPSHTWTSSISPGSSFTSGCPYPPGTLWVRKALLTLLALRLYPTLQASLLKRSAGIFALDRSI